jgi:hypothetical protein
MGGRVANIRQTHVFFRQAGQIGRRTAAEKIFGVKKFICGVENIPGGVLLEKICQFCGSAATLRIP